MSDSESERFELAVVRDMQHWLDKAVIGLNLCPFAKAVHVRGQIRYAVCRATDADLLESVLRHEMQELASIEPAVRDTTLLIATDCLLPFRDFNDFLDRAEHVLEELELNGVLQIASFHPQFQFAGTTAGDVGNATNRAPYPTLHLLREASVDRAVAAFPQAEAIFENNIATMERIGSAGWDALGIRRSVPLPPVKSRQPQQRRGRIRK